MRASKAEHGGTRSDIGRLAIVCGKGFERLRRHTERAEAHECKDSRRSTPADRDNGGQVIEHHCLQVSAPARNGDSPPWLARRTENRGEKRPVQSRCLP